MGEIWGRNGRETVVAEWRWAQGEGFCSGIIITPLQKGEKSGLTIITCIQGGADGPDRGVPVVSQTLFKNYFVSNQVDAIYDFLSQTE